MNNSDYIVKFLMKKGIDTAFGVTVNKYFSFESFENLIKKKFKFHKL